MVRSSADAPPKVFQDELKAQRPCLIAALGGGRSGLTEVAQEKLREKAEGTVQLFAGVFKQGRDEGTLEFEGKPEHAAAGFFAMLQGLQTLARVKDDYAAFRQAAKGYIDSISRA